MENKFLYILFSLFLLAPIHTSAMSLFKKKTAAPTEVYPTKLAVCSVCLGNKTIWLPVEQENFKRISTTQGSTWYVSLHDKELTSLWKYMIQIGWRHQELKIDNDNERYILEVPYIDKYPRTTAAVAFATGAVTAAALVYWFENNKQ
jgi:hypothetical protein